MSCYYNLFPATGHLGLKTCSTLRIMAVLMKDKLRRIILTQSGDIFNHINERKTWIKTNQPYTLTGAPLAESLFLAIF